MSKPANPRPPEAEVAPMPSVQILTISEDRDGQRLDNFLFNALKGVPKTHVYRLLRTGQVRINGKRCKPDTRIATGDLVRVPPVRVPEPRDPGQAPERLLREVPTWVVFEDRHYLVFNKPSGIAAHGGSGVSFGAIELLRQARPDEDFELVHRLDRDTSGVLVFAKRRPALTQLQTEIRENRTRKRYLALLSGQLPKDKMHVDVALAKNVLQGGERMVTVDDDGKPSRSTFRVLERLRDATYVEVLIETGRTHQIRVHAQHLGHPLLGDDKYGDTEANRAAKQHGLKRLFLHAAEFGFSAGEPRRDYRFEAPLAPELEAVLAKWPRA
ncbi:MAG: RluA family pseudouridine synthase [Xanthomonadales bacterium]|nr:RluA family pseudouridine synthase [Xanthomonadales bacterium]MBP7625129.1 RluA family pseudouridine synthase [Xanthomonadales bacterium]